MDEFWAARGALGNFAFRLACVAGTLAGYPVISRGFKQLKSLILKNESNRITSFYLSFFRDVTWLEKLCLHEAFELINQQTKLKELAITIKTKCEWTVKNDEIQVARLEVNVLSDMSETSKRNLERFVKSQGKIESFSALLYESYRNKGFYSSMLQHIHTLETIRSISLENIGMIEDLPTKNHHVESLTIRKSWGETDYLKLFPNLKTLEIHVVYILDGFIQLINSIPSLEELVIIDLGRHGRDIQMLQKLDQFQMANLKRAELYSYNGCDAAKITEFTRKHPNLLEFRLNVCRIKEATYLEVVEASLKNLKNLQKLMLFIPFHGWSNVYTAREEICKLIEENAMQLDTLVVNFGVNTMDVPKDMLFFHTSYDYDYWGYYKSVIDREFAEALPYLKFKFLWNHKRNPWN